MVKDNTGEEMEMKSLRIAVQDKKIIIGTQQVLKALKSGKIQQVYLASNCPVKTKEDVQYFAKIAGVTVTLVEQTNQELGIWCKKNFYISVLGI